MTGRRLLVLRPQPGAERTATTARAMGFDPACYPLFHVTALPWTGPESHLVDAVMLTSANSVRHGGAQLARYTHLPAFAVGEATAAAAETAGFSVAHAGHEGAQAVIDAIAATGHRHILHLSGHHIRPFDPRGLRVTSVPVYASVESGDAEGLAAACAPGTVILVHSPRAGRWLAELMPEPRRGALHLVAISAAAREAAGAGWAGSRAAPTPDDKAMLALAAGLCE
jgi:uroporphyrinogen-III synthase